MTTFGPSYNIYDRDVVPTFHWHVFEVGDALPTGWIDELLMVARDHGKVRDFYAGTVPTAREDATDGIPIEAVDGDVLTACVPWIAELYHGAFRRLGRSLHDEDVYSSSDPKVALSLNIQRAGAPRYPCHVDSNPVEGLLYLTDCTPESGGELAVALDPNARNTDDVDANCRLIYPRAGQLLFFDARRNPHYVRPILRADVVRAVVTMNYYSPSCPESVRPAGLDDQLFAPSSPGG